MYRRHIAAVALLAGGALHVSCAVPAPAPKGGQDYQAMAEAMEAAQAEAYQPGDEKLTCEQLEQQVIAVAQDPTFQAHIQKAGADAEKDMAAMQAAQAGMAGRAAATAIASMVPGAAMGHMMAGAAEGQAKQAQAAERMQSMMAQAPELMALMPKLLRGQRLIELGAAKNCEWAAGLNAGVP